MVVPHIKYVLIHGDGYKMCLLLALLSVPPTTKLLKSITLSNTTFFSQLPKLFKQIPAANISAIQLDWQPIGADCMQASEAKGGNALGLDSSKIYLCYAEVVEWIGSTYGDIVAQ
ncbi:hypothetical protein BDV23DRAFT_187673 [Aspergillus alliaceus]|uniref:Uncharacterized protein n=1 Tax=Petromyces alliaceus TaxID=209559 RepID=A0A5N7BW23_PETAA|nr:hypothetical protein BDV23DRAFT_187673 [Aspergillus alliaceus]